MNFSPFELEVLQDGDVGLVYSDIPVYIVRSDRTSPRFGYEPRHFTKPCPPQVNPAYDRPIDIPGTIRTDVSRYGWMDYMAKINNGKEKNAMGPKLAMFNGPEENTLMESLLFGEGALIRAVPSDERPYKWAKLISVKYEDGPPDGMPTYWENPIFVQRFTAICRSGNTILHASDFYYPIVFSKTVYMQWSWLERATIKAVTKLVSRPVSTILDTTEINFV